MAANEWKIFCIRIPSIEICRARKSEPKMWAVGRIMQGLKIIKHDTVCLWIELESLNNGPSSTLWVDDSVIESYILASLLLYRNPWLGCRGGWISLLWIIRPRRMRVIRARPCHRVECATCLQSATMQPPVMLRELRSVSDYTLQKLGLRPCWRRLLAGSLGGGTSDWFEADEYLLSMKRVVERLCTIDTVKTDFRYLRYRFRIRHTCKICSISYYTAH